MDEVAEIQRLIAEVVRTRNALDAQGPSTLALRVAWEAAAEQEEALYAEYRQAKAALSEQLAPKTVG
jgi:hypothetical protein